MKYASIFATLVLGAAAVKAQPALPPQPVPTGNLITVPKALLGKALFWDEQLSSTRSTACGTCHIPSAGMADPRPGVHPGLDLVFGTPDDKVGASTGPVGSDGNQYVPTPIFGLTPQVGTRRALATINLGHFPIMFWDGRVEDEAFRDPLTNAPVLGAHAVLENLIAEPPVNDFEMAHFGRDWNDVVARVQSAVPLAASPALTPDLAAFVSGQSFPDLFQVAFGTPDVTASRIVMAIATYLRTLESDQSRFDAFMAGQGTLTAQEQQGFMLFNMKNCNICHTPPFFGGAGLIRGFANTGVRPPAEDRGRFLVTGISFDDGAFRIPSLRNVELRAPFFHNGGKATLAEVIDFYDAGGDFPTGVFASNFMFPLGLTAGEKAALQAFLRTLTDPRVANELPPFDRPALASESHAPATFGTSSPLMGGPRMVAVEPPYAGNPALTLGVDDAPVNGTAVLFASFGALPGGFAAGPVTGFLDPGTATPVATLPTGTALPGHASVRFPIPPSAAGVTVHAQWLVFGPSSLTASDAASVTIF